MTVELIEGRGKGPSRTPSQREKALRQLTDVNPDPPRSSHCRLRTEPQPNVVNTDSSASYKETVPKAFIEGLHFFLSHDARSWVSSLGSGLRASLEVVIPGTAVSGSESQASESSQGRPTEVRRHVDVVQGPNSPVSPCEEGYPTGSTDYL